MWNVCRYFDDHYECIVSKHDTKEKAIDAKNKRKPGEYVSYEVRKEAKSELDLTRPHRGITDKPIIMEIG